MYLVLDIGATKTRLAFSVDGKNLENIRSFPTPGTVEDFEVLIRREVQETPIAVGAGCTRRRRDLAERLPALFSCPTYLENDAAMAGLAEAVSGAGKGSKIVLYLTVSTGVGGVRIVDTKIDQSTFGFEPGRQLLQIGPETKSLEDLISGRAFAIKYNKPPFEIEDPAVWQEAANHLALGLHNSIVHWSPGVIVIGGQMVLGTPSIDLTEVERHLMPLLTFYQAQPAIKRAVLGDNSGLLGALIHCCSQKSF